MTILALALGTPLRGDDGAGLAAARGLDALLPGLKIVELAELLPEHAEDVSAADAVLFLDTSIAGTPGEVRAIRLVPETSRAGVIHALTPEEILDLARSVHGRCPPAALVTIGGKEFAFGDALSPEVEAALPLARERARELVEGWLSR